MQEQQAVIIIGATGTGETYLACAPAQQACRKGYRTLHRRGTRLFDELKLARADGGYGRLLARFARTEVLVIDDRGLTPVLEAERHDLCEILEDRHEARSTILTSQLPTTKWHDYLEDPTVADAILDRILNHAHRIVLKGPSRRKNAEGDQEVRNEKTRDEETR